MSVQSHPTNQKTVISLFLVSAAYTILITVFFTLIWLRMYNGTVYLEPFYRKGNYVIIAVFLVIYLVMARLYGSFNFLNTRITEVVYSNLIALVITCFLMYVLTWIVVRHLPSVWPILQFLIASFLISIPWAWLGKTWIKKVVPAEHILVIYDNEEALSNGLTIIGSLTWRFRLMGQIPVGKNIEAVKERISDHRVDAVMLCGIHSTPRNAILKYCVIQGIKVYIRPNIGDLILNSADNMQMANLPVMLCERSSPKPFYDFGKRIFDVVLGLIGFVIFSPFMLVSAIAIKAYDHGPVFYRQIRLTRNGRRFFVYKFRSMRVDAEKDGVARLATENDDRITPVGKVIRKLRIDEMPQIFCILKGDMSLVGPRPERPEIASEYEKDMPEFSLRLQVKAGLTGQAQVYGKYNTEPYDKLQMDLNYISRRSFITDIRLILMTIKIIFMPESTEGIAQGKTTAKK